MEFRRFREDRATGRTLRVGFTMLALATLVSVGCASATSRTGRTELEPRGPGHVFSTVEEAVFDAMAYSVLDARRNGQADRMYGGAVTITDTGYTYSEPVVAKAWKPLDIRYRITARDVARYHVYPRGVDMHENRHRERITRWDRISVDDGDPRHRTLYFLTPSLVVKAYHGEQMPVQEIARLDRADGSVLVVQNEVTMP